MRNLLGRLHARTDEQRVEIAKLWRVSVFERDSRQYIGRIYQVMTDIRAIRDTWTRLGETEHLIINQLSTENAVPLAFADLTRDLEEKGGTQAVQNLLAWGIISVDGDLTTLPQNDIGLFIPGELMLLFRRVIEEQQAGDISDYSIRRLLEMRDDVELEISATKWGLRAMPGLKRRADVIAEILDAIPAPGRMDSVLSHLKQPAASIWRAMLAAEDADPQPYDAIIDRAGLTVAAAPLGLAVEHATRLRGALEALENSLLVNHTWLPDGSRGFFVPEELRNPQSVPVKVPLSPIQPLPEGTVTASEAEHPFALAWDVMTVVREIAAKGPPVWIPGQELPTHWLRLINSRLWFHGESEPPPGYAATLLHLAMGVGALEPAPRTPGMEKAAIKPVPGRNVRWWRGLGFAEQTERLRQQWLSTDFWVEGRESGEIEIRSADWIRFRHRLLTAIARFDPDEWVMIHDASLRLAEQDLTILGDTFEAVATRPSLRSRRNAIGAAIEVELTTGFRWFGFVETQLLDGQGIAMRVTPAAVAAARDIAAMPESTDPTSGPILTVNHEGVIVLRRPAPVHIWSLTAFAESEELAPKAIYQLRMQSVGAALGAGFDLQQITTYLENQSGAPLPDPLETKLREWTAGYKRVKLRRAVMLELDVPVGLADLRSVLEGAGFEVVPSPDNAVMVMLPDSGDDGGEAERNLTKVLRKAGYVGLWVKAQRDAPDAG
ncbi:MAG: helicase-associated domain-containing protein [Thermomicrobiales bacterium]|nr:helicase-associated domain-containing protein [Thermomicrobiales bacterium]